MMNQTSSTKLYHITFRAHNFIKHHFDINESNPTKIMLNIMSKHKVVAGIETLAM